VTLAAGVNAFAGAGMGAHQTADPLSGIRVDLHVSQRAVDPVAVKATPTRALPAPAPTAPAPAPAPAAAAPKVLPIGKGMWLHQLSMAGNDAVAVVNQAKAAGLTHVYLRLGSSKSGFYDQDELNRLLPVAHAAGIKVIGWDFPYLFNATEDAQRAKAEADYVTPTGDQIDGFAADVETDREGVNINAQTATSYSTTLRQLVGPGYPLIAVVPRFWHGYPYGQLAGPFDAVAPMVYWMNSDPAAALAQSMDGLAALHKPFIPVGQAYNGAIDHGPPGAPSADALNRFMQAAADRGSVGVSFWVWQLATPEEWGAITNAHLFDPAPMAAGPNDPVRVTFLQRLMNALGVSTPVDGKFGEGTRAALIAMQRRLNIPPTGEFDPLTIATLFRHR